MMLINLNTSYVSIQYIMMEFLSGLFVYLNTSYVSIQLGNYGEL